MRKKRERELLVNTNYAKMHFTVPCTVNIFIIHKCKGRTKSNCYLITSDRIFLVERMRAHFDLEKFLFYTMLDDDGRHIISFVKSIIERFTQLKIFYWKICSKCMPFADSENTLDAILICKKHHISTLHGDNVTSVSS